MTSYIIIICFHSNLIPVRNDFCARFIFGATISISMVFSRLSNRSVYVSVLDLLFVLDGFNIFSSFSSRSLGSFLKPRRTWWATILQISNACYFMYVVTSSHPTSAWVIFIFVFVLGCVGGICYVHTFHRLLKELPPNQHKFSLGMITIAESIGIAIGGFTAIALHNLLCGKLF